MRKVVGEMKSRRGGEVPFPTLTEIFISLGRCCVENGCGIPTRENQQFDLKLRIYSTAGSICFATIKKKTI